MPYVTQRQSPAWKHMDPIFAGSALWPNSGAVISGLTAWFDTLDTTSMLSSTGALVSEGGTVATFQDKAQSRTNNVGYVGSTASDSFTSPASSALNNISGSFALTFCITPDSWTPAATNLLLYYGTEVAHSISIYLEAGTGKIAVRCSKNGTTEVSTILTSASTGYSDGVKGYLRITRHVSSTGSPSVYKSSDGTTWVSMGGATSSSAGALYVPTDPVILGHSPASLGDNPFLGKIHYVTLHEGYANLGILTGPLVAYFDPTAYTYGTTITASTGEAWTRNGTAYIAKSTDLLQATAASQPTYTAAAGLTFDGSNDYLKTSPFTLNQPTTVYFIGKQLSWTNAEFLYDGNADATMGARQSTPSPELNFYAGNFVGQLSGFTLNTLKVITAVFNSTSSVARVNLDTAITGNAGTANAGGFQLGARGSLATFSNIAVNEVAIFNVAHSADTRARLIRGFIRKWRLSV